MFKEYCQYLTDRYDAIAQTHKFDEPVDQAGFNFTVNPELVELHVMQEGDRNLIWGNVQNAIVMMKRFYHNEATPDPAPWVEIIVQQNYWLQGYVRMASRGLDCSDDAMA